MPNDRLSALTDLLQIERDRPLGDVTLVSNRARSAVSHGLQAAAENLLAKALRALRAGDRQRAEGYVARAGRLDFDTHEEVHPAWMQAHMLLFESVTDALEECPAGDYHWLDAALATLPGCGEHARTEFLHVLAIINHDWRLEPRESRRIKATLGGLVRTPELETSPPGKDTELVHAILQILDAVAAYHHALDPADE